ncbi:MAG: Tail fiber protein [Acidobacteriota bacterium]|nr:Tail fiber protein [Acidobacteriota bacterium]
MFLLVSFWGMAEEVGNNPVAVSPGSETEVVTVWQTCPTFSWSAVDQAASYRIAVFETVEPIAMPYENMAAKISPVISKDIPGPALSWTLSSAESLKSGSMYVWYVQALDATGNAPGLWSSGRIFKVEQEIRFAGVEEKLAEKLRASGVNEETITDVLKDIKSEVKEVVVRNGGAGGKNTPDASVVQGTEGSTNTFYGQLAGNSITSGFNNTFIGNRTGQTTSSGYANTFLGQIAGYSNTTGYSNTFLGNEAGNGNTEGYENTFIGRGAGAANNTGNSNTFLGFYTGSSNKTGNKNTLLGYAAGNSNTTGSFNIFIGHNAGKINTIGGTNTFIGNFAGYNNTTANGNIFIGEQAGYTNTTGYDNIFIGNVVGYFNTTGCGNIIYGHSAGFKNTTGSYNIFFGSSSGNWNTTGSWNTFIGNSTGRSNTTGIKNVFVGLGAGYLNSVGESNVFLGFSAGYNETGSNKLYISNSDTSAPLIYGQFDNKILTVNGSLGVGTKTPAGAFEIEKTGSNAIFIFERTDGAQGKFTARAGEVYMGSGTNHRVQIIANNAVVMTLMPNKYVGIGIPTPLYPLHMSSGARCSVGGTWTNASSRSLKENIENLCTAEAIDALIKLNPVKYNYKVDKTDKHVGFIAEDAPELVATSDRKGMSPMDVVAVLTKVVQEQQTIIINIQERLAKMEKTK